MVDVTDRTTRAAPFALLVVSVVVAQLGGEGTARASGFYMPGRGVRPMGRAGAYVATSDGDLNALWYNPANLAGIEELTLTVDLAVIGSFSSFDRAPRTTESGETKTYREVSNSAAPKPDPQVLIGGPTPVEGLTWSAGVYAPYAAPQTFPKDGPQRYALIDNSKSTMAWIHAAVAYQVNDWLRVGGGIQNMLAHFEYVNTASGYTGMYGRPEDRDLDILTKINVDDYFAPSGNLGATITPAPGLKTAVSVQFPFRVYDEDAKLQAKMPSHPSFDNAELSSNRVAGGLNFPLIARLGVGYRRETFDVELAAVYERWSTLQEIEVKPKAVEVENVPGVGAMPVSPLSIPKNWRDTFSIRLGGDVRWSDTVTTRLGYAYETGAVPKSTMSVFSVDRDKHMIGGGMTYDWGRWELDASLGWYLLEDARITSSELRQINPVDTEDELATVIGNGKYEAMQVVGGLGVNWTF
ncbi:MAG: OmpP1/FadL family transporter [Bradymonadaceae bacterium]